MNIYNMNKRSVQTYPDCNFVVLTDNSDVLKQDGESNNSPITAITIVVVVFILMVILTPVFICYFRHKIVRKCK